MNTKFTDPLGNPYWQDVNPNVLYAVWEVAGVELQYRGFTEAYPDGDENGEPPLLKSVFVQLDDLFDYTYDQNKDDDPTNDYIPYRPLGWWNAGYTDMYNQDWVDGYGYVPTIQEIADAYGWDGEGPIIV